MNIRMASCALALLLTACGSDRPGADAQDFAILAQAAEGYTQAAPGRRIVFPADHGAHPDYRIEWWYLTGNLESDDGRRFGYQLTLFRVGLRPGEAAQDSDWRSNQVYMGHLAVSDIAAGKHYSAERFARAAAGLAGASLADVSGRSDARLRIEAFQ